MSKEIMIKYIRDTQTRERFFPVTHVSGVIGMDDVLDDIDNMKDMISSLRDENMELKNRVAALESTKNTGSEG